MRRQFEKCARRFRRFGINVLRLLASGLGSNAKRQFFLLIAVMLVKNHCILVYIKRVAYSTSDFCFNKSERRFS